MMFNVESVGGVSKAGSLVEVSQVAPQVGVVDDTLLVALNYKIEYSVSQHKPIKIWSFQV